MFYSAEFDPTRIIGQIILLQSSFYLVLSLLFYSLYFLFDIPLHIALIFSSKSLLHYFPEQWYTLLIFTITVVGIVPFIMQYVVMRPKMCLDFLLTMFAFHWLFVFIYDGMVLPYGGIYYYLYYLLVITLCVISSEYLCMRLELSAIPLDFLSLTETPKDTKKKGGSGGVSSDGRKSLPGVASRGKDGLEKKRTSQKQQQQQEEDGVELVTTTTSTNFKTQKSTYHKRSQFHQSSGSETEQDENEENKPLKLGY